MVIKKQEVVSVTKPSPFQGKGEIQVRSILDGANQMHQKGRVFAHTTIYPESEIGYHVHEHESETYYILSGIGRFNDNGRVYVVTAGDVTYTGAGEGHGLANAGEEPLNVIALILYD